MEREATTSTTATTATTAMTSQGHFVFKVFINWKENQEIRSFVLHSGTTKLYSSFIRKLHYVVPLLATKNYKVTWTDQDGDELTISMDEEIRMAIDSLKVNNNKGVKMTVVIYVDNSPPMETRISDSLDLPFGFSTISGKYEDNSLVQVAPTVPGISGYYTMMSPTSYVLDKPPPPPREHIQLEIAQQIYDHQRKQWQHLVTDYNNYLASLMGYHGFNPNQTQNPNTNMVSRDGGYTPGSRPLEESQIDYQAVRAHIKESMPYVHGVMSQSAVPQSSASQGLKGSLVQMAQNHASQGHTIQAHMGQRSTAPALAAQNLNHQQSSGSYNVTTPVLYNVQNSGTVGVPFNYVISHPAGQRS